MKRAALSILALAGGCFLDTGPKEAARDALGPNVDLFDDGGGSPTHRPNQPCLLCHDGGPGAGRFFLAGTVYLRADDPDTQGLEGASVHATDARGRTFSMRTNRAGNFWASVRGDDDEGGSRLGFRPEYPIEVRVELDGREQIMRSRIQREGSCAACHTDPAGRASAGRIYVEEAVP